MLRKYVSLFAVAGMVATTAVRADVVIDWNKTIYDVMQNDGTKVDNKANPGWATRSIAMLNGAIYDAFQAVNRTHAPYKANMHAPANTSLEAAIHQAAYEVLYHCYPNEQPMLQAAYNAWMDPGAIPDGEAKTNGMNLGHAIAHHYKTWRTNDKADESIEYTPPVGIGMWSPDPFWPGLLENPPQPQEAWGPGWRDVKTFGIPDTQSFIAGIDPIPALNSAEYAYAYNQVKELGALNSASRDEEQTKISLFWAYDRPSMGPPPTLFVRNMWEVAEAVGQSPEDNARLFAQASVAMADAAVAAWDAKFEYNFWRPVTAIHAGDIDTNDDTVGDPNWHPLGAPGNNHAGTDDDFTPPFPAWTSGHATMGAAVFKSIEQFFGKNSFGDIIGVPGAMYTLTSEEEGSGGMRSYAEFAHYGTLDIDTYAGTPDGENGISRVFLGIHWLFDQQGGLQLGHNIANFVSGNYFQAVPEPSAMMLALIAAGGGGCFVRRRQI